MSGCSQRVLTLGALSQGVLDWVCSIPLFPVMSTCIHKVSHRYARDSPASFQSDWLNEVAGQTTRHRVLYLTRLTFGFAMLAQVQLEIPCDSILDLSILNLKTALSSNNLLLIFTGRWQGQHAATSQVILERKIQIICSSCEKTS